MFGKLIENFSSTTNEEVKAYNLRVTGIILLVWGCLLYLVDATIVGKLFLITPGVKNLFRETNGSLDLSGKLPSVISMIIIFVGIILVLHAHSGLKAQANMIVCPLFYTLSFMFIVAGFQLKGSARFTERLVAFGISLGCLVIGVSVHAANKDKFPELEEEEPEATN